MVILESMPEVSKYFIWEGWEHKHGGKKSHRKKKAATEGGLWNQLSNGAQSPQETLGNNLK